MNDNKRIAKNTLLLYFRQLLIMAVSLYTSRVVLQTLGETDFGIYSVVGGVVTMFSFLMTTMASASQRYLSYDLASGDVQKLKETFGLVMLTYVLLAIITVVLTESIAVWFLNTHMTIPTERLYAANWVLQFSILTFIAHIFATPYLSVIISHERMGVYAYVSIADVILKLLIVCLLVVSPYDKLIFYSILMFFSSFAITLCYKFYCHRKFEESKYRFFYNQKRLIEMTAFAWWNMVGSLANVLRSQGINILLNMFFNPTVNAARGIAYQVNSAIMSFANNFYTALRPQVIKSYATKEKKRMLFLISSSSRMAFYLLLLISLPIVLHTSQILHLWLGNPPEHTELFVQLVLVNALAEVYSMPLVTGLQATGKIKVFQLTVSSIYLLNFPISYVLLQQGGKPEITMYVNLVLVLVSMIPRLWLCHRYYGLSIAQYGIHVLGRSWLVAGICYCAGYLLTTKSFTTTTITGLILSAIIIMCITAAIILGIGITTHERKAVLHFIKHKITH